MTVTTEFQHVFCRSWDARGFRLSLRRRGCDRGQRDQHPRNQRRNPTLAIVDHVSLSFDPNQCVYRLTDGTDSTLLQSGRFHTTDFGLAWFPCGIRKNLWDEQRSKPGGVCRYESGILLYEVSRFLLSAPTWPEFSC